MGIPGLDESFLKNKNNNVGPGVWSAIHSEARRIQPNLPSDEDIVSSILLGTRETNSILQCIDGLPSYQDEYRSRPINEYINRDERIHAYPSAQFMGKSIENDIVRGTRLNIVYSDPNDKKTMTPREALRHNLKKKRESRAKDMWKN